MISLPVLEESFELLTELACDDLGSLWEARERGKSTTISIKVFDELKLDDTEQARTLLAEAAQVSALRHPNIVEMFGHGRTRQGRSYIAMERLSNTTLASVLRASGPLPQTRALAIAIQLLEALSAMHRLGVSHRDLQPHNIALVERDGAVDCVKLGGFGSPRRFSIKAHDLPADAEVPFLATETLPRPGEVFGTPEYVHSDQMLGSPIDALANVYSVGVILYQAITGLLPFIGASASDLMCMHRSIEPMRPSMVRPDLGILRPLEDLIVQALSKNSASRPSSVQVFLDQLVQIRHASEAEVTTDTVRSGSIVSFSTPIASNDKLRSAQVFAITLAAARYLGAFCCMYLVGAWLGQLVRNDPATAPSASTAPPSESDVALRSVLPQALATGTETNSQSHVLPVDVTPTRTIESNTVAQPSVMRVNDTNPAQSATGAASTRSTHRAVTRTLAATPALPTSAPTAADTLAPRPDSPQGAATGLGLQRAQALLANNLVAQACAEGRVVAEHSQNSPAVWDFLGRCYMRLGQAEVAREYYRKYLALAPNSANAPFVRAIVEGGQQ